LGFLINEKDENDPVPEGVNNGVNDSGEG